MATLGTDTHKSVHFQSTGIIQHIHRWYIGFGGSKLRSSSSGDTSKSSILKVSVSSCLPSFILDNGKKFISSSL